MHGNGEAAHDKEPHPVAIEQRQQIPEVPAKCVHDPRLPAQPRRSLSDPVVHRGHRTAALAAGVEHRLVTYPGAPHSFFDRKAAEFAEASRASWREITAFIEEHTSAR